MAIFFSCPHCGAKLKVVRAGHSGIDWKGMDWNRRNVEIARETKIAVATIASKRALYGHPWRPPIVWESVDWSLTNGQIAKRIGRRRGTVYMARRKWAPETMSRKRGRPWPK